MIKVLIVDDSQTVRELLQALIESDPAMKVIACAKSGEEALAALKNQPADIVTMDLHMPGLSGSEVTRQIMSDRPVPIVIVTADKEQALHSFHLLEAGAVAVLETPAAPGHPDHRSGAETLLRTLKMLAGIKLVRRMQKNTGTHAVSGQRGPDGAADKASAVAAHPVPRPALSSVPSPTQPILLIGASTGGPQTIKKIVHQLNSDFRFPIVVAQHMAQGFLPAFADWLNEAKTVRAKIAEEGENLQSGHLYLAPDDFHTGIDKQGRISLSSDAKEFGLRPSVSFLFRSAASCGRRTVAVLLSGMGRDGAVELGLIKNAGGITIAQDEESCIVFGMPGEAIKLGNAQHVLAPAAIADFILNLAKANDQPEEVINGYSRCLQN